MWRGNEAAFTVAFERHAAGLLGFCRHMVGSPEEAEDAVQHTFVAAFRHLRRRGERRLALKPWLYAIARNRCLSTLRSRRELTALDLDLRTEGLTEQVERRAELRELLRDLLDLPEDQRAALLLTQAGDLSHAEVADVLGCEVANVKALVFRARSGLIQRRDARETACEDIREQLANLRVELAPAQRTPPSPTELRGLPGVPRGGGAAARTARCCAPRGSLAPLEVERHRGHRRGRRIIRRRARRRCGHWAVRISWRGRRCQGRRGVPRGRGGRRSPAKP
jgi:RNA polymerase sigma factor (sigma-70 family)